MSKSTAAEEQVPTSQPYLDLYGHQSDETRDFLDRLTTEARSVRAEQPEKIFHGLTAVQEVARCLKGTSDSGVASMYQLYNHLLTPAWLGLSFGLYDDATTKLASAEQRLHRAQLNTLDATWHAAVTTAGNSPVFLDVGCGFGQAMLRVLHRRPDATVVGLTLDPEQASYARALAKRFGVASQIDVRVADVRDPSTTSDLRSSVDAVGIIEMLLHLPLEEKQHALTILGSTLKSTGLISVMDLDQVKPLPGYVNRFLQRLEIHPVNADTLTRCIHESGLQLDHLWDYSNQARPSISDTTRVLRLKRAGLRATFGATTAIVWPEIPKLVWPGVYKPLAYMHRVLSLRSNAALSQRGGPDGR